MHEAITEYLPEDFFQDIMDWIGPVLEPYGYELASTEVFDHFDVCEVKFRSQRCWIRLGREKGAVFFYLGRAGDERYSFSYSTLLRLMVERGRLADPKEGYGPGPDWDTPYTKRLKKQLRWLRESLLENYETIHMVLCGEEVSPALRKLADANRQQ